MKLLEHFKELSLHPKNAEELKGLILQLAVQGKLTAKWREENPEVKDATKLLERITAFNEEQLKLKKRRIKKLPLDPDSNLDLLHNWIQTKNHVLFSLAKGKNPKDLSESVKKYPYQDIESLARGNIRRYSDDEKAPKCTKHDILVVCDGSRSGLVLDGKDGIVGSTLAIIETPPFIQNYIKLLFLQGYQKANSTMKGAAIPHLDTKTLLASDIRLPPLEEQKAIVEVVNTLFKEVEQLESLTKERIQLKESIVVSALNRLTTTENTQQEWNFLQQHFSSFFTEKKNIKSLRETILQLAVQGKLSAKWRKENPDVENALVALEHINAQKEIEKELRRFNRGKLIDIIDADEEYFKLPDTWQWLHIKDVVYYITDYQANGSFATLKANVTYYDTKNFAVLVRLKDLRNGLTKVDDFKYTDEHGYNFLKKSSIHGGELLIANVGAGVGTIMQVPEINFKATLAPNMFCIHPAEQGCDKGYFKHYTNSPLYWTELNRHAKGTGQPKINKSEYRSCRFPLPPLEEQKVIVEKVNPLMALCDDLEQQIETSQTQIEQLMQSCLKEVFEN